MRGRGPYPRHTDVDKKRERFTEVKGTSPLG